MSDEPEGPFVPALEYETMKEKFELAEADKFRAWDTINQLQDALKKVNVGMHKASDMSEGLAHTNDQKIITDLAFELMKRHPEIVTIKYKGETIVSFETVKRQ